MTGPTRRIEAEMRLATGCVLFVRRTWDAPIELHSRSDAHHLELSLLPRSQSATGCYPDRWSPLRFDPIGELFFLPAGELTHIRSECRDQNSVIFRFEAGSAAVPFDGAWEWNANRLAGGLDLANPVVRSLMFRIGEEIRTPGYGAQAMVEALTAQIVVELARHFRDLGERGVTGGLSPWHLRLIDERLAQDPSCPALEELGQLCNLSVRHLTRAFRVSRGRTIGSYISHYRMEQAKEMLASGLCVKSTAHRAGFTSPTNFASAFRRATGESPRQYRRRAVPARPDVVGQRSHGV